MIQIDKTQLPVIIDLPELDIEGFVSYYNHNKDKIESVLHTNGAIKFTGIAINTSSDFENAVNGISSRFLSYIDGNSPRTKLSDNVYTSTEYDASRRITMHNELSYSSKWPNKVFFSCLVPAETGGETLIADSREILRNMDAAIVKEIENRGIRYIRNLHGGMGIGPSWQDTFETTQKQEVSDYCHKVGVLFEWGSHEELKIIQESKGIIEHRNTKERLWFNQLDQFHPLHLGRDVFESLQLVYEKPENFPMYVEFGDGKSIDEAIVEEILSTIDDVTYAPKWQKNELLVLDNELVAHGRNSFTGNRKVLVAMSE